MGERTVERLIGGVWAPVEFMDLKKGDTYRMFEPDGTPVVYKDTSVWIAIADPSIVEGIKTIHGDEVDE